MAQPPDDRVKDIIRHGIASLKDQIETDFRGLKANLDAEMNKDVRSRRGQISVEEENRQLQDELRHCRNEKTKKATEAEGQIRYFQAQIRQLDERLKAKGSGAQGKRIAELQQQLNQSYRERAHRGLDEIGGGQEANDGTITADYATIIARIQLITGKHYPANTAARPVIPKDATRIQRVFLGLWGKALTKPRLTNRTQAVMTSLISTDILSSKCFGLERQWKRVGRWLGRNGDHAYGLKRQAART
jgi:hypothetical protein